MFRRRIWASAIGLAIVFAAGGAWSYFKLATSGENMNEAATKFLSSLTAEQRSKAAVAFDDKVRIDWHFIPKPDGAREGLRIRDMNEEQRRAAHTLLKAALSEAGYSKATQIMALEQLLHELEKSRGGKQIRDTERYFFTVYGAPSSDGKWGISVEGHHLSLNFVVDKGQVVSTTPAAFGANPAIVKSDNVPSIKKGTRVLAKEETLAIELVSSLTEDQKKEAIIAEKPPGEVRAAGEAQAAKDAPRGIAADKLTGQQRGILQSLIEEYAKSYPPDVAQKRLEASQDGGPAKTYFAWAGSTKEGEGRYYCIQAPSFQIEFVNVQADSAGNPANHIHSVWRDLKGDFAIPVK